MTLSAATTKTEGSAEETAMSLSAATEKEPNIICDVCAGGREQRIDVCAGAVNNAQNEREANTQSHVVDSKTCQSGATPRSGGAPSISTCWVVHSGYDHGDVPLLRNHNLQILHDECWFDYGDAHKGDHRLRRLKREKPDLVIIHMANVKTTAQPQVSCLTMLQQVSEIVQEQLKSKRDAIVYGFNYERQLWAAHDERERRGSPN